MKLLILLVTLSYNSLQSTALNCIQSSKYRTLDGTCNNLLHPKWGAAQTPYHRLLPSKYRDEIWSPPISVSGKELPGVREISLKVFGEKNVPDKKFTLATMSWGQFVAHDMSKQVTYTDFCCTDEGQLIKNSSQCMPIFISKDDPMLGPYKVDCFNFLRSKIYEKSNNKPMEQINFVTSFMDLSIAYGNSDEEHATLRAYQGGRLLMEEKQGHLYPPKDEKMIGCEVDSPNEVCYKTGDDRANQNPGLTIYQIMLVREHNRLVDGLAKINPFWDDEKLFQEARRINIAEFQHITYYEYLPMLLGKNHMLEHGLTYDTTEPFINDYIPEIDPSVFNSHGNCAYRYFHTQIAGRLDLVPESRFNKYQSLRLSKCVERPGVLEMNDNFDDLSRGLATQPQESTDINFDREIKHYMFARSRPFGADLRAVDIQRGRDHGIASYNDFRQYCGLKRALTWNDFFDTIPFNDVERLWNVYESVDDVDFAVGGALETHLPESLAGPTFHCILSEQFYHTRIADRFFFEREDPIFGFNAHQLKEIRKSSMARLLCDNGNNITNMQKHGFLHIRDDNQVQPCSEIPSVDLRLWEDDETEY